MTEQTLLARIDRLESLDEIRQLAAKYALSLDMRDMDAHVNLFVPDIRVSRDQVGRAHLKRWPDREAYDGAYHELWPSWAEFRSNPPDGRAPEVAPPAPAPAPLEQFLIRMRRGAADPKIRVR